MIKKLMISCAIAIIASTSSVMAQITLTDSDYNYNVGQQLTYLSDTSEFDYDSYTTGSGGPMQWDFSSLSFTFAISNEFVNPATAPQIGQFPGTTHCIETTGLNSWGYFHKDVTAISDLGHYNFYVLFGDTVEILIKYQAPALLLPFPTSYGYSWNTFRNYKMGSSYPTHDSTVIDDSTFNVCNGWGTAKFGSKSVSCLRIKSVHRNISHIYTDFGETVDTNTSESYQFIGEGTITLVSIFKIETAKGTDHSANGDGSFVSQATAVRESGDPALPTSFTLEQNTPNPFNPTTTIRYNLERSVDVKIEVLNLLGESVFRSDLGRQSAGVHEITWGAESAEGKAQPSGVYFYRLTAGAETAIKKMLLLK